jgi:predicted glycogen debranching enzyme
MDPEDSLLYAGETGQQLTWMDAKVGDWVVTPRIGKPVEVNALWYNALCSMQDFCRILEQDPGIYAQLAGRVRQSFGSFWLAERGYCFDVLDAPDGNDPSFRPNQLFAVSLTHSPLLPEQQKAIVDQCGQTLLTSHGLRSLAPGQPGYTGSYGGNPQQRDGTYHQGTVWSWLIGPFVRAHLRVYNNKALARSYLEPLLDQLSDHGLGSISEIFDGNAPFTSRGAIAQAWSVAELLAAWQLTEPGDAADA